MPTKRRPFIRPYYCAGTHSALKRAHRGIEFRSEVATAHNFLFSLTGCDVLHFTWNGDGDQEQVQLSEILDIVH